jgi:D-glycero-D-manno-heptose 1,7-bisphosphate phosphatase
VVKAIFFDRDGVLAKMVKHGDRYTAAWLVEEFEILPEAKAAVDLCKSMGYQAHVVTNQPDILDKLMTQEALDEMHSILDQRLGVDSISYCKERSSRGYKPNSGMVDDLCIRHNIDRHQSFFIGDSWRDVVCGYRSGLTTFYVSNGPYTPPEEFKSIKPDYIVANALEACYIINQKESSYD